MLATGTQFAVADPENTRKGNFYISASYEALTLASFLSAPSNITLQTLILIVSAMMNVGHVADGWALSGIITRQAHMLNLHRSPSKSVTSFSAFQKQERIRLWQTIRAQDTFLSLFFGKPPLACSTDCSTLDIEVRDNRKDEEYDLHFLRSMWDFTSLIQTTFCVPLDLDMMPTDRSHFLDDCHLLWQKIVPELRELSDTQIASLYQQNPRVVCQLLFLRNNYYNCIMMIHQLDGSDEAVDAAMSALDAYLLLHSLFGYKARVWWTLVHRSFTQSVVLAKHVRGGDDEKDRRMAVYVRKMIAVFEMDADRQEMALGRVAELKEYLVKAGVEWR